jgi:hypothetical protein
VNRPRLGLSLLLVAPALGLVTATPASAAPTGCGYHVGSIFADRGAGNGAFEVSLIPGTAGQSCTLTVPSTGLITLPGGGRPSNVANNPSAGAVTVTFSPFLVVPRVSGSGARSARTPRTSCSPPP